jgi:hypothetical protein
MNCKLENVSGLDQLDIMVHRGIIYVFNDGPYGMAWYFSQRTTAPLITHDGAIVFKNAEQLAPVMTSENGFTFRPVVDKDGNVRLQRLRTFHPVSPISCGNNSDCGTCHLALQQLTLT